MFFSSQAEPPHRFRFLSSSLIRSSRSVLSAMNKKDWFPDSFRLHVCGLELSFQNVLTETPPFLSATRISRQSYWSSYNILRTFSIFSPFSFVTSISYSCSKSPPSFNKVARLFKNEKYCGRWKGNLQYCEPYITPEQFDRIHKSEKNTPESNKWLLALQRAAIYYILIQFLIQYCPVASLSHFYAVLEQSLDKTNCVNALCRAYPISTVSFKKPCKIQHFQAHF